MGNYEHLAYKFTQSYIGLVEANFYTGYWDNKRNDYRKAIDKGGFCSREKFVNSERESRKNCEARGVHRNELDQILKDIIHV